MAAIYFLIERLTSRKARTGIVFNTLCVAHVSKNCEQGGGPLVTGHAKITSTYMNKAFSSLTGLNAIIGLFSSMAVNMRDFGSFSKNGLSGYHQFFALPVIGTLGALTPIFVTSAHS